VEVGLEAGVESERDVVQELADRVRGGTAGAESGRSVGVPARWREKRTGLEEVGVPAGEMERRRCEWLLIGRRQSIGPAGGWSEGVDSGFRR